MWRPWGPCPVNFLFTGTIIAAWRGNFNRQKYQTYYNVKRFFVQVSQLYGMILAAMGYNRPVYGTPKYILVK